MHYLVTSEIDFRLSEAVTIVQPCANEGIQFLPVVVETLGGWHPEASEVITKLAKQLASRTGGDEAETIRHFFQRLSVLLNQGNSSLILSRIPDHVDALFDGDLDMDV